MVQQNRLMHAREGGYGGSGHKHASNVIEFAQRLAAKTILDYGCGEGTLRSALRKGDKAREIEGLLWKGKVYEYDPAITGKELTIKAADLVVCTDVLEHVEPKLLTNVIRHIASLAKLGVYLNVALRKSNKILPDGRNAHLITKGKSWWFLRMKKANLRIVRWEELRRKADGGPHSVNMWIVL
jgi:2-polyprenyl-3-methyl-5-hydroxy-6-metoxy-1,4-benzoquinol methylase